jgi:hypothetical protein
VKEHDSLEFFLSMPTGRKDSRQEPVAAHLHYVEWLVANLVGNEQAEKFINDYIVD